MSDADCGCCEGGGPEVPREVTNPPALPAVQRRVGTHAEFLATMEGALGRELAPGVTPLRALSVRAPEDFTIALLDAWATVADVLTFYQERITNESYRRTATERRSLYELARLIGYRPGPGLAAAVALAFSLDDFPQTPPVHTVLASGLKVQSVPEGDEQAQLYETVESIPARSEWNALRPRRQQPPVLSTTSPSATVSADAAVAAGDPVLIVAPDGTAALRKIRVVHVDRDAAVATLDFVSPPPPAPAFTIPALPAGSTDLIAGGELDDAAIAVIRAHSWRVADVAALCRLNGWDEQALEDALNQARDAAGVVTSVRVFVLRQHAGVFGYNAPIWDSLPFNLRFTTQAKVKKTPSASYSDEDIAPAHSTSWENRTLEQDASPSADGRTIFLDNVYPGIVGGSWIVLTSPTTAGDAIVELPLRVKRNAETTRTAFGISGKTSRLLVAADQPIPADFRIRTTAVLGQSEPLAIAPSPVDEDVSGREIMLDGAFLGLRPGGLVVVAGEPSELPGVVEHEVHTLADALLVDGHTLLQLEVPLRHGYRRGSVRINANVAPATHGETREEILGGGDASLPFQRFVLRQPPLTHVSSASATGVSSTLEIFVNETRWTEVLFLSGHGPQERIYSTWTDDTGSTVVQFGDGHTGARPPTGQDNIRAVYRRGIGLGGLVKAGSLTAPMTRPLGLAGVTNPLPPLGAADPELADELRDNLPLRVMTLGRVVSLRDYEDFSRAFAGVRKALAVELWDGERRGVFITVAGPDGAAIPPGSTVHASLTAALRGFGDPHVPLTVDSYRNALFRLDATLTFDPAHPPETVRSEVADRLRQAFGFEARALGQPVTLSEVIAEIQAVEGVVAVDVNELYRTDKDAERHPEPRLGADLPTVGRAAGLLMIDTAGITLR
ncbi:MAG TPA: putative baseplate assembly protein [Mycobacteriales bacterium]|nr:putative baseplate assembly protein [Mycobacteriales bacterium]